MITNWSVRIAGDDRALSILEQAFGNCSVSVRKIEKQFFIEADVFLRYSDPGEVMNIADGMLGRPAALLRLKKVYIGRVRAENAVWMDERGGYGGILTTLSVSVSCISPARAMAELQGQCGAGGGQAPRPKAAILQEQASKDPAFKAMTDLAAGWKDGRPSWGDLHMLYETVCTAFGGEKGLVKRGMITPARATSFRQTANSFRHGGDKRGRPKKPMSLVDAASLLHDLVSGYLERACT